MMDPSLVNTDQKVNDRLLEIRGREQGGVMSLVDAYCRVNRARGMELLSPDDLVRAAALLEKTELPLRLRRFDSGVCVLQLASHSDDALALETSATIEEKGSATAGELSRLLGIPVVLAKERLLVTERAGKACRDDSVEGLRFYPNRFLESDPSTPHFKSLPLSESLN